MFTCSSCSSLTHDSTVRHRTETITRNGEESISQEVLLSEHGLVQVPNDVTRSVAGMFRLAKGFPDKQEDIGTERDKSAVFEGKVARTQWGSSSDSAASYPDGVDDGHPWGVGSGADGHVGVVVGLSPELK